MWVVTASLNQEIVGSPLEVRCVTPEKVIKTFELCGYSVNDYFTTPEWNRYVLQKWIDGLGLAEITIEEEDD